MNSVTVNWPCPDISRWRKGNTGTEGVWHFDSGQSGRHVMISALIHGNEWCGAWALKALLESGVKPTAGKLTLMFANLVAFDRFDPANPDASRFVDEDMNRQWLDIRLTQPQTLERQRVVALLPWVQQADWLLDLHSMHEPGPALLLTGVHPRNQALARQLANPSYIVIDAGHKDGVRMRDYGRFGATDAEAPDTRSLLIECGFHGDPASQVVARDLCLRFLDISGAVSAAELATRLPGWRQADAVEQWSLKVTGLVVARSEKFRFTEPFTGLPCIPKAGTVIGDNDGEPVITPYPDCMLVMPSTRQARAGVTVVRFAQRQSL